jgi:hypothetical protein
MQAPERLGKPEVMVAFLQDERERMARLVKAAGIRPE